MEDEKIAQKEFSSREKFFSNIPFDREKEFYQSIKDGDMEKMLSLFSAEESHGFGKLSEDSLRNLKYHLVITVGFITRSCIEGGMEMDEAYDLSGVCIRKLDECNDENDLMEIHKSLCKSCVTKIQERRQKKRFSAPVQLCVDYVAGNLCGDISLEEIAKICSLNSSYVSSLFHREVGVTFSRYVQGKRIEEARRLLLSTDFSTAQIARRLHFSSESHLISVFKRFCGTTPKKFRQKNFRDFC
jgi:YesN/AraC family two-component response regulator